MPIRPLTPEEIAAQSAKGNNIAPNSLVDDDGNVFAPPPFGPGAAFRQFSSAILPAIVGRKVGGAAGAALTAPIAATTGLGAPAAEAIGTIGGMLAGGMGTSALQDYALRQLAEEYPGGNIESFVRKSELDRIAHPYLSQIAALGATPFAGGQLRPNLNLLKYPRKALELMGIQTGISAAHQMVQNRSINPLELDPRTLGIAALSGLQVKTPPTSALNAKAFENAARAKGVDVETAGLAPNQKPDWQFIRKWWAEGDPAEMSKVKDQASQAAASIRKAGIPMSEKDWDAFATLGAARGWDYALKETQLNKQPQLAGIKPADEAVAVQQRVAAANQANAAELARIQNQQATQGAVEKLTTPPPLKSAEESAGVIQPGVTAEQQRLAAANVQNQAELERIQNQQAQQSAIAGLTAGQGPVKSAAESAEVIAGRPSEVKGMVAEVAALKKAKKLRDDLLVHSRKMPENTIERMTAENLIHNLDENLQQRTADIIRRGGERLLYGAESIPPEGYELPGKEVPEEKPTPVPEKPETVQAQVGKVAKGLTPAALVTPGEVKPAVPPTLTTTKTTQGEVIHEPGVSPQQVKQAAAGDKLGPLLGHATETQPAGAKEAVALTGPGGQEIKTSAVTPATKAAEVVALSKQAEPGEKVVTTTPENVIAQRLDVKPGDVFEIGDRVYTVSRLSGIKENPTVSFIGGSRFPAKVSDLAKMVAEGRALHNPEISRNEINTFQRLLIQGEEKEPQRIMQRLYPKARDAAAHFMNLDRFAQEDVLRIYNKGMAEGEGALSEAELKKKVSPPGEEKPPSIGSGIAAALEKNKEAGFLGIPEEPIQRVKEKLSEAYKEAGNDTIKWLRLGLRQGQAKLLSSGNPVAELFVKKAQEMDVLRKQGEEQFQSEAMDINRDLSRSEKVTLDKFIADNERTGKSDVQLTPKLAVKANQYAQLMRLIGLDKARPDSAFIQDYDKAGNPIFRPFAGPKPGYAMYAIDPRVREVLQNPTKSPEYAAKYEQYKDDFIKYNIALRGDTYEQASRRFDNLISPAIGQTAPNPEFQANRYAQGIGLPDSMRMNMLDALSRGITRHFTDVAFHRAIESDPVLNRALNLPDNGRGEKIGDPNASAVLAGNPNVKAILRGYVGQLIPETQNFEKWQRLITAPIISTWSGVRDIAAIPGIFTEIAQPSEYKYLFKAAKDAITPAGHRAAIEAGALRPTRNTGMAVSQDAGDFLSWAADNIHKYTGSEAIQQGLKAFNYSLSRQIAHNRVLNGDQNFIRKWGPANPERFTPEALADYIAVRLTGNFSGSYNFEELPNALLPGSGSPLKVVAPLARWSVGRFNRWYENVYEPAKEGNIGPLLRSLGGAMLSAGAVNWLKEKLTGVKPKELTWQEFLKLGGRDTAYTLFSKANIAGYGGILTDLAFAATQTFGAHEKPYGWQNPLFQIVENAIERGGQWADSMGRGEADMGDWWKVGFQFLKDQVQVIRMVSQEYQDEGTREEKIARRTGYLPPGSIQTGRPNPLSASSAYKSQDPEQLRKIITSRLSRGLQPPTPQIAIRQSPNLTVPMSGSGDEIEKLAYYKFIYDSQGPEAAHAALERDRQLTLQRLQTFQRAAQPQ